MQKQIRSTTIGLNYWYAQHARLCFGIVLATFIAGFAAYIFFVVSSLSSGVAMQKVQRQMADTDARIANLEAEHITRMRAVDIAFAKERGFVEVSPTRYIAQVDTAPKFSMRETRY